MIVFKQKQYSEFDAMRSLYVELMKRSYGDKNKYPVIDTSALLPILKGNNVVIERFVIASSIFGKDKYRMTLKIGTRAKLPEGVRLPTEYRDERLGNVKVGINGNLLKRLDPNPPQEGGKKKGPASNLTGLNSEISPYVDLKYTTGEQLGKAIKYDKSQRTLVLEFTSIDRAIKALDVLPFGMNYKVYLLNA